MINPGLYKLMWGPWSYGSWIYNYQCNQCLSPLMLWARIISIRARYTTLCDKVCQWHTTGPWFSPGPPVSSTNKTDRHDITEILLKVALNTIKQTNSCEILLKYNLSINLIWICQEMNWLVCWQEQGSIAYWYKSTRGIRSYTCLYMPIT